MPPIELGVSEIQTFQTQFGESLAIGSDDISPRVVNTLLGNNNRMSVQFISAPRYQQVSDLPECWRVGNVVPVHKFGAKQLVENYMPTSLISTRCKVIELNK